MQATLNVLEISASGRHAGSVSRQLSRDLVAAIEQRDGAVQRTHRDLAEGVPFVDDRWIEANFTPEMERSTDQRKALAESDRLVGELKNADVIVIGSPVYNFGVPAALKAWVDMVARARLTFRYTASGPVGLLDGKKAYLVMASNGVAVDSPVDFATPYLRHALAFVGIDDVEVVAADQLGNDTDAKLDVARARIADLVHTLAAGSRRIA